MRRVSGAAGAATERGAPAGTDTGLFNLQDLLHVQEPKKSTLGLHFVLSCKQTTNQMLCTGDQIQRLWVLKQNIL